MTTTYSYAQQQGVQEVDWRSIVSRETLSETEWAGALIYADSWKTDPCGNQSAAIGRTNTGAPIDKRLSELGTQFYYAIKAGDLAHARETLGLIEERSAHLLTNL